MVRVWSQLCKLLNMEGAEPQVSAMFYRAVIQAVLLFWVETWFLLEIKSRKLEVVHLGFLRHITSQKEKR